MPYDIGIDAEATRCPERGCWVVAPVLYVRNRHGGPARKITGATGGPLKSCDVLASGAMTQREVENATVREVFLPWFLRWMDGEDYVSQVLVSLDAHEEPCGEQIQLALDLLRAKRAGWRFIQHAEGRWSVMRCWIEKKPPAGTIEFRELAEAVEYANTPEMWDDEDNV